MPAFVVASLVRSYTRVMPGTVNARIALATSAELPELDDDERLLLTALRERGIDASPQVWTDESIDWSSFDLVVIRSTWDYTENRDAFLAWTASVEQVSRLLNPADLIAWNSDKRYLRELEAAGIPIVPTQFVEPGDADWLIPADCADYVVKPAISAGSRDTARYAADGDRSVADAHVRGLLDAGRVVMIQPYLDAVDTVGETALIHMAGEFSHSICKGAMLPERASQGELSHGYVAERISARTPSDAERAMALRVLECVPGGAQRLLYARVDLIPDAQGDPTLIELEVTEPSLFFGMNAQAPARMAQAILDRL